MLLDLTMVPPLLLLLREITKYSICSNAISIFVNFNFQLYRPTSFLQMESWLQQSLLEIMLFNYHK